MTDLFVWHGSFICKHNSFICVTWRPTSPSIKRALFPIKRALSPIKISLIPTKRSLSPVKRATCSSRWALFAIKQPYILWKEPHFVWKQSYFVLKEHSMSNIFLCPFFFPSLDAIYFSSQFQRAPDFTSPFSSTYMYKSVSYFLCINLQRVLSSMKTALFCIKEHQSCFGFQQLRNLFSPHKMRHIFLRW